MPETLQLDDFYITHLQVHWHQPEPPHEDIDAYTGNYGFDYDVLQDPEDTHTLSLVFRFALVPQEEPCLAGFEIEAEIRGLFRFPESMDSDVIQRLVRYNGGMILYGLLRGHIAAFTGAFPSGKFTLPAVNMAEVVEDVERRKNPPQKKTPRGKAVAKKAAKKKVPPRK